MPDTSICITAKDNYSETVKKMTDITHHFLKDAEKMEETLRSLSKQKVKLKLNVDDALADLKDAEKAYRKFQDEASLKRLRKKYSIFIVSFTNAYNIAPFPKSEVSC